MSIPKNPFAKSSSIPGKGDVVLTLLPPRKQVLSAFNYQYPLKLIAPDPHNVQLKKPAVTDQNESKLSSNPDRSQRDEIVSVPVHTIFLLTYGGGLIGGDSINLTLDLSSHTRLALLTQGSTKIFKSPNMQTITKQILDVRISAHSSLVYLPDPNQPYGESVYEQRQTFYVDPYGSSSLLMLDWVSEGRKARGESWSLWSWRGRNEVREFDEQSKGRLLLRDSLNLHEGDLGTGIHSGLATKTNGMGILGTLIVYGPIFKFLAEYLMKEFRELPRIGAKSWATHTVNNMANPVKGSDHKAGGLAGSATAIMTEEEKARARHEQEQKNGLLWTASQNRGFVLVKFGAKDLDSARQWLGDMLRKEGTVEREFGHQALLCLR